MEYHDDVIKWKHFPRNWPFVLRIQRSPVNSPHKGLWRGGLMFSLICTRINDWVNNGEAGDLRRHRAHYDVIVMFTRHQLRDTIWARQMTARYLEYTVIQTKINRTHSTFDYSNWSTSAKYQAMVPDDLFQHINRMKKAINGKTISYPAAFGVNLITGRWFKHFP